jgi:hypothetical protein
MAFGLRRQALAQTGQILTQQGNRLAQLQHQPGIHGVLAGCAQMHVLFRFGILCSNPLTQGLGQRNRRIARGDDGLRQRDRIIEVSAARGLDRRDSRLRNHPTACLGTRQRRFEVQHALQSADV